MLLVASERAHEWRSRDRDGWGHEAIGGYGGLRDAAVIECVGLQPFDLGQDRRVVGLLGVELVAAQDLDAVFLGLFLERIGDADPVSAGIIENIYRLHLEVLGVEIGHVRALEGVCGHGAEIDRLALRLELRGHRR